MARRDDRRVAVLFESSAAKVDHADIGVEGHAAAYLAASVAVEFGVVPRVDQQDVLRLEISVRDAERVQKVDRAQQLPCKVLHNVQGEGAVAVAAHEVKEGGAKLLEHDADVALVVKPVLQVDAAVRVVPVVQRDRVEHL